MRTGEAEHAPSGCIAVAAVDGVAERAFERVLVNDSEELGEATGLVYVGGALDPAQHLVLLRLVKVAESLASPFDAELIEEVDASSVENLKVGNVAGQRAIDEGHGARFPRARVGGGARDHPGSHGLNRGRLVPAQK